jgi:RNA polymerase sigma factor (sigma-70 family)
MKGVKMVQPSNEEITKLSNEIFQKLCSMGANPQDAKEIVQESLYRGFLNIEGINAGSFRSWLYRVSINQYYDMYRKNKRYTIMEFEDNHISEENHPEDMLIKQEDKEEYEKVLEGLKPIEKALIKMKYEDDYSYKEIAGHLDLKESNVKTYLYRARKKLAGILRRDI